MVSLFLLKLLDNTVGTFKNINMIKGNYLRASISAGLSSYLWSNILTKMTKADDQLAFIIVALAVIIGTYVPAMLMQRREKEKFWVFEVTPKTSEIAKELADELRDNNLSVKTERAYRGQGKKTLTIKVFCETKAESQMTLSCIEGHKHIITEVKNIKF